MEPNSSAKKLEIPPGFSEVTFDDSDTEQISDDDEIVLIQTPLDFHFDKVNQSRFKLHGRIKSATKNPADKSYKTIYSSDLPSEFLTYNVLIPHKKSGKLKPIPRKITGHLTVVERIDVPESEIPEVLDHHIPFPPNLRESFVPYGSGPYLESPKKTQPSKKRRWEEEEEDESEVETKIEKKKHKKSKRSHGEKKHSKKKKKKRKHSSDDDS